MKRLIALLLLLIPWPILAADLSGASTASVGEIVWLNVEGEPAFDSTKTVGENSELFRAWFSTAKVQASSPDGSKPTLEPDVQIKFSFAAASLAWDLRIKFVADKPGTHVIAALIGTDLVLHRVQVGGAPDPDPEPDPDPDPDDPPGKITRVTYVYEKDLTVIPRSVSLAIQKLNADRSLGIVASQIDDDILDGDDQMPDQYKVAITRARADGLPCLVVQSIDTVVRVVKAPTTEQQVLDAAKATVSGGRVSK